MNSFLDSIGLDYFWGKVKSALGLKADASTVYTKTEVDDFLDDMVYLSDDDGSATTASFDAQADTVWNKAQTLGSAQQAQARSNIGAQEQLVSGTNIKTINNQSLLGSGNITISGGGGDVNSIEGITMNGNAITPDANKVVNLGTVITAHQDISGKANSDDLATVATSGSYTDLVDAPQYVICTLTAYNTMASHDSNTYYIIIADNA